MPGPTHTPAAYGFLLIDVGGGGAPRTPPGRFIYANQVIPKNGPAAQKNHSQVLSGTGFVLQSRQANDTARHRVGGASPKTLSVVVRYAHWYTV